MTKRLIFNAFAMNAVSHVYHGLWRHPETRQTDFNDLSAWIELAKLLEEGRFDGLFLADIVGVDKAYRGSSDIFVEQAIHFPANDPTVLAAALIGATEHLGLMFTSSILQSHPFDFARRVSTLDHLSKGRVGWNIVTGVSREAAKNFNLSDRVLHDERYRWADEYVEAAFKLWEGSWEDDAVVSDKERGVYADPDKVHKIHHKGERYQIEGPHLSIPSSQRTPVLIQAGSSAAGRRFAAGNAEATFIVSLTPDGARVAVDDIRRQATTLGRDPSDILFFQGLSFVVGSTEEEAWRKSREIDEYISIEGLAAHIGRDLEVDFGFLDPDRPVSEFNLQGLQGFVRFVEEANPGKTVRLRDLVNAMSYNGRIVGTPEIIADKLEEWRDAGIDGVNVAYQRTPGSFIELSEYVMPELRRRKLAQEEYRAGTLREKLFPGRPARLNDRHPAARFRNAYAAP